MYKNITSTVVKFTPNYVHSTLHKTCEHEMSIIWDEADSFSHPIISKSYVGSESLHQNN